MSTSAVTESSLDILSRAAVAAGIMAKRFRDENAPPTPPPQSLTEDKSLSGDEKAAEANDGTRTETKKSTSESKYMYAT